LVGPHEASVVILSEEAVILSKARVILSEARVILSEAKDLGHCAAEKIPRFARNDKGGPE
jgi:hypothetical protein